MSYVDGIFDRSNDIIKIVERDQGKRQYREYPARYTFYYPDPKGKYESVYGEKLGRVVARNQKDFHKELKIHSGKRLYESDINPIFRCLEENYLGATSPKPQNPKTPKPHSDLLFLNGPR